MENVKNDGAIRDSRPEKKTEQEMLLELQMRAAKKARIFDIFTIATLLIILYGIAAAMLILPDSEFSEQENRVLQQMPSMSSRFEGSFIERVKDGKFLNRLLDGSYTADIAKYYADQFPARDAFVGLKGIAEIAMLKRENNGVVLAKDGYLIKRGDFPSFETVKLNLDSIITFANAMGEIDVQFALAVTGRPVDMMGKYLPSLFPTDSSEQLWYEFETLTRKFRELGFVNLKKPLQNAIDSYKNEQIYYRTDHHWTTLGAYYAYAEIIKNLGGRALPVTSFTVEKVSTGFYGTSWSSAGMKWVEPDTLTYYRYEGDEDFITEIDGSTSFTGFYDRSYLDAKDKYSSFLGGNHARIDVTKQSPSEKREKLLIIKDSFAHSVAPFLAYHYDLVIIDLRYFTDSTAALVVEEGISRVLILNYIGSMTEANVFGLLNFGIDKALETYKEMNSYQALNALHNLYINGNSIADYVIACPDLPDFTAAAELLQKNIADRMSLTLEIVKTGDLASLNNAIILSDSGLPATGFIQISVENDNLILRSTADGGIDAAVQRFNNRYLKTETGSINFGSDFQYLDVAEGAIIIMPR